MISSQGGDDSVKIISKSIIRYLGKMFGVIEGRPLNILRRDYWPRFHVNLYFTRADIQKHRSNSKRIPQFETTNYLALKRRF